MRRLLVNDALSQLGERTFWGDLMEWFGCDMVCAPYGELAGVADIAAGTEPIASLIIRNATWFPPLKASERVPTISLLQDIITDGPLRKMQEEVSKSTSVMVFNSRFTAYQYGAASEAPVIIPLPVDFSVFTPGNPMGLQQALGLPDGCVCWIGASQGAAGHIKGWDVFLSVVRLNPDLNFVAVFKDEAPDSFPPNLRVFVRLPQVELAQVIGACRVGICTSRMESQHLAGIEMGACGLPIVAPPVGIYWKGRFGVSVIDDPTVQSFSAALRDWLSSYRPPELIRESWRHEFDRPVIKAAWTRLIEEVEK